MTIAVTGGTGFLGKYLVHALGSMNYNFFVVARPEEQFKKIFPTGVSVFESDYSEKSLSDGLKNVDVVLHLAAQTMQRDTNPYKVSPFFDVNLNIAEKILSVAIDNHIHKVVLLSSNNVYSSSNPRPYKETIHPIPASVYGLSKLFAEQLGEFINHKAGVNVVSLRLARLFGYGERDTVVFTKFMKWAMNKQPLQIWGRGYTKIEYLYVRDAVTAILAAAEKDIPSGSYNVGSNKNYSVIEIANAINDVTGNKGNLQIHKDKPGDVYQILMDSAKFMKEAGWKAQWQLEKAIMEMYQLYKKHEEHG